jgi:hypothetical protein
MGTLIESPVALRLRSRRSPRLRRALIASLVALGMGSAAIGGTVVPASATPRAATSLSPGWYIDSDNLHVFNADEDDFWSDGDEPEVAVVAFRTKLGVRGSTSAWKVSNWSEICTNADAGDNCTIPDWQGRAFFGNVSTPTLAQIAAGVAPELVGTIQVTMESDATPYSALNQRLDSLVNATRTELAATAENLTPADIAGNLGTRFSGLADRIKKRVEVPWWQDLATWLGSFSDPDDKVGVMATVMVGVDQSLADQVNLLLLRDFYNISNGVVSPKGEMIPAVIGPRTIAYQVSQPGVSYGITERVFHV